VRKRNDEPKASRNQKRRDTLRGRLSFKEKEALAERLHHMSDRELVAWADEQWRLWATEPLPGGEEPNLTGSPLDVLKAYRKQLAYQRRKDGR
jgi:hypothetical protein